MGTHLVEFLSKMPSVVLTCYDLRPHPYQIHSNSVSYVQGDLSDTVALETALQGQDIIYHLAILTNPSATWNNPEEEVEVTLKSFLRIIEYASQAGVRKIVLPSSGGTVYGMNPGVLDEKTDLKPFSPHGIIKVACENFLLYAKKKYSMSYDIYRISNPYGPGQKYLPAKLGVIANWLETINRGEEIEIFGDGRIIRDFIYISDAVEMLSLSIKKDLLHCDVYNIGSSKGTSLRELAEIIDEVLPVEVSIKFLSERPVDNLAVILDNKKILAEFQDFEFVQLKEGILKTWDYLTHESRV